MKLRIFIDFWNFQINVNNKSQNYKIDWKKISHEITKIASLLFASQIYFQETNVYISFDPNNPKDKQLQNWANTVLDQFPGINVTLSERKPKNSPVCNHCHTAIHKCPHCGQQLKQTVEKGVDTAIVTDLFSLAWAGAWDAAVLLSSDRDFIPAIQSLSTKGFRVINGHFPPQGMDLARACWGNFNLYELLPSIER